MYKISVPTVVSWRLLSPRTEQLVWVSPVLQAAAAGSFIVSELLPRDAVSEIGVPVSWG